MRFNTVEMSLPSTKQIKINKAQCLECKDIIESTSRHHFQSCSCEAIFVDGGKDYIRHGYADPKKYINLSEYY